MRLIQLLSPDEQPEGLWNVPDELNQPDLLLIHYWAQAEGCLATLEELVESYGIRRVYIDEEINVGFNKTIGYQVVDYSTSEYPEQYPSFAILSEEVLNEFLDSQENKSKWKILSISPGDIENPTFINSTEVITP